MKMARDEIVGVRLPIKEGRAEDMADGNNDNANIAIRYCVIVHANETTHNSPVDTDRVFVQCCSYNGDRREQ